MIQGKQISPEEGKRRLEAIQREQQGGTKSPYRAVVLTKPGSVEDLELKTIQPQDPGEREVQVLVKAFSLNFGDLLCVKGLYPTMPDYPFTPGFEFSGVVVKTGREVRRVRTGDEVIGVMGERLGAQTDLLNITEAFVVKKPSNITHEEATAFPIVFLTMKHVFDKARVKKGEKLLIQTAAGGTGLIAVQMAKELGAEIFATCGSQEKLDYLRGVGVEHLINYREEDFAEKILSLTGGYGVDVVINTLSGDAIQKGLDILAPNGRYMEIAMTGLKSATRMNLSNLVDNQIFYSIDLRKLMLSQTGQVTQYLDFMADVLESGRIKPTVGKVLPFSQIQDAYRFLENRDNIGKIVVRIPSQAPSALLPEEEEEPVRKSLSLARQDIAIIGMAGRFPDAANVGEFWRNLESGKSSIREVPKERWDPSIYYDPEIKKLDKTNCKWGGFLADIDQFDAAFFNISGKEAEMSDPQQRLLLEECWNALEDAGYAHEGVSGTNCAVYVGVSTGDYVQKMDQENVRKEAQTFWGNASSVSAARISYLLNLKGPSVAIDTACSSSLVAIHLACQSILTGECGMALAGGVFVQVTPNFYIACSNANMLSPDGRSAAFDNDANGFVPGEGVGVVVLKALDAALRDGDHIYGVIKGSAINQDGKTNGITAPSSLSQQELELAVYEKAQIDPGTITYVETHGTGTKLGDPIEIEALTNSFGRYTEKRNFCAVGSVKTNIGHTVTAAGVVSVIKVLLALKHKRIPPSLNLLRENEHIDFASSPFYVNTTLKDWQPAEGTPLRAAVSSFGFSGTNAHVVIEEAPAVRRSAPSKPWYMIPLSARTEMALKQKIADLLEWLKQNGEEVFIGDIAYTLLVGRSHLAVRAGILVRNTAELREVLGTIVAQGKAEQYYTVNRKDTAYRQDHALKRKGNEMIQHLKGNQLFEDQYKEQILALLDLYLKGYELEWGQFYADEKYCRIPLPTYPFSRKRYWLDGLSKSPRQTAEQKAARLHPLIEQNTSDLYEQRYTTVLTGTEYYLTDHLVGNDKVLPGVVYLEWAQAAGKLAGKRDVVTMKNIVWSKPISVNEKPLEAHIALQQAGDLVEYEIYSLDEEKQKVTHNRGKLGFSSLQTVAPQEYVRMEPILSRCRKIIDKAQLYPLVKQRGLELGPGFQVINEVFGNGEETLSIVELPKHLGLYSDSFLLHPSLLDGSLQTALLGVKDDVLYVPFSIGEVEIFRPVTEQIFVYAVRTAAPDSQAAKFDVQLLSQTGEVLVRIKDFVARPFHFKNSANSPYRDEQIETLHYMKEWMTSESAGIADVSDLTGHVLLLADDERVCQSLQSRLSEKGKDLQVILIKPGSVWRKTGPCRYEVRPDHPEDMLQVIESLKSDQLLPQHVIYLWSMEDVPLNERRLEDRLGRGIYHVFAVTKALIAVKGMEQLQFLYLFPGRDHLSAVLHSAVSGFAKSIRLEHPGCNYKVIELAFPADESAVVDLILAESDPACCHDVEIRYTETHRLVKRAKEVERKAAQVPQVPVPLLKQKGVYLITGGTGGLGYLFARYLAKQVSARLVLTGRSSLGEEQAMMINELETLGAEAMYIQADVANRDDMRRLFAKIEHCYRGLDGIIHSAGVLRDGLVAAKTVEHLDEVLAPKVWGTILLDEFTKDKPIDFFVLFSSLAAEIGNSGQTDYAYANSFMDHFAEWRQELSLQQRRSGKTLSINWPLWRDGGMQMNQQTATFLDKMFGIRPLEKEAGIGSFLYALSEPFAQVIVLSGERQKLARLIGEEGKQAGRSEGNSAQLAQKPADTSELNEDHLQKRLQTDLISMVANILKLSEEDIFMEEEMSEFGFDSLTFTEFSNQLFEKYAVEVMPSLFFEFPTLLSFSQYLRTEHMDRLIAYYHQTGPLEQAAKASAETQPPIIAWQGQQTVEAAHSAKSSDQLLQTAGASTAPHQISVTYAGSEPIAIIGMSGVMPQSENLEEFWKHLEEGRDLISEIPSDRWDWRLYDGDPTTQANKTDVKWGGFMRDAARFDNLFFGISHMEAELMDPQQRILMETIWKTIEDAGYKASALSGTKTGLFIGVASTDYADLLGGCDIEAQTSTGMSHSILVNRISYLLNLRGPSEPIDTACSSSLVAVHRAVEQLHSGECELAIAGGVNVMASPTLFISFSKAGMLCKDGRCKTFDKNANGYVRGEGVGTVLLKPLRKALQDGDHIYGVIKGTAVNHGGKANSLTAPNPNAQAELIIDAWRKANVDPSTVTYIEAHGTGTPLGDPIEINGLKKAFDQLNQDWRQPQQTKPYCGIGSVKTNIGHLETAAGIAGLFKVLLAMRQKTLPASIHFREQNPYIQLEGSPFYIVTETRPWQSLRDSNGNILPRRAGVSSFGFGGVNAHLAVEEFVMTDAVSAPDKGAGPELVLLSAKSEESLSMYVQQFIDFLENGAQDLELADIAYTLQAGREAMGERLALIAGSKQELVEMLRDIARGVIRPGIYRGRASTQRGKRLSAEGNREYDTLAKQWVEGHDIDWTGVSRTASPKRVPLPTYPFSGERFWVQTSLLRTTKTGGKGNLATLHPLVGTNLSTLNEAKFLTSFSGEESFLTDHVVAGQKVLPGAVYLEMARAAGEIAGEKRVKSIRNLVWSQPISFAKTDQQSRDVSIRLVPASGHAEYQIMTRDSDATTIHSQGEIVFEDAIAGLSANPGYLDVADIRARCRNEIRSVECYRLFESVGLEYGPHFQCVKELCHNEQESLSRIELPPAANGTWQKFVLHPSLLDASFQTVIGVLLNQKDEEEGLYVPYAVGELQIFRQIPESCYAYAAYDQDQSSPGVRKFNIQLVSEDGQVAVALKNFAVRAYRPTSQPSRLSEVNHPVEQRLSKEETFVIELLKRLESGELSAQEADRLMEGIYEYQAVEPN